MVVPPQNSKSTYARRLSTEAFRKSRLPQLLLPGCRVRRMRLVSLPSARNTPFTVRPAPGAKYTVVPGRIRRVAPAAMLTLPESTYGPEPGDHVVSAAITPETAVVAPLSYQMSMFVLAISAPSAPNACTRRRLIPGLSATPAILHDAETAF